MTCFGTSANTCLASVASGACREIDNQMLMSQQRIQTIAVNVKKLTSFLNALL